MKRDPRSIWNKSRKAANLSNKDLLLISRLIHVAVDSVYDEMNQLEDDLRSIIPDDDFNGLSNDVSYLERRVTALEDWRDC